MYTSFPELDFVLLSGSDDDYLHLEVKKEYSDEEDAIVIDIIDQFEKHRHFLHNTSTLNPVVPID